MRARPFLLPLALLALSFTAATAHAEPIICDFDSPIGPGEELSGGSNWIGQFFSEGTKPQAFRGAVSSRAPEGGCQTASENSSVAQRTEQRERHREIN